jgi:hypothetical protein
MELGSLSKLSLTGRVLGSIAPAEACGFRGRLTVTDVAAPERFAVYRVDGVALGEDGSCTLNLSFVGGCRDAVAGKVDFSFQWDD